MPCYKPLHGWYDKLLRKMYFGVIPKAVMMTHYDELEEMSVPCGKCIGCRLERSRKWAMRCVYEAKNHKENCFLTLTYSPENLPEGGTLVKRDLQLFFKRLRKAFPGVKIRYFACGEYGEQFARPHYHVILFGLSPTDYQSKSKKIVFENPLSSWIGRLSFPVVQFTSDDEDLTATISSEMTRIWGLGHVAVGDVTFESCAYVARYCLKKINGDKADEHYQGRLPEFILMSRRPGIAADWYEKNCGDVFPNDVCFARGVRCKPPRYFDKLLEKADPELFADVKAKRKVFAKSHNVSQDRLDAGAEIAELQEQKYFRKYEKNS